MFQVNFKNKDFRSFYLQLIDMRHFLWYNTESDTGVSPSGKARDFDSLTRKFKSCYPCQQKRLTIWWVAFVVGLRSFELISRSESKFTYSARRSESLFSRRRAWVCCEAIPCYIETCPCGRSVLLLGCAALNLSRGARVSSHTPRRARQACL